MKSRAGQRFLVFLMVVGDVAIALGAFASLYYLVMGQAYFRYQDPTVSIVVYAQVAALVALLLVYRAYTELHRPILDTAASCGVAVLGAGMLAMVLAYVTRSGISRIVMLGVLPLQAIGVVLWRLPYVRGVKKRFFSRPAVLVTEAGRRAVDEHNPMLGLLSVQEIVTPDQVPSLVAAKPFWPGGFLMVVLPDVGAEAKQRVLELAAQHQVETYVVPGLHELLIRHSGITRLTDLSLLELRPLGITRGSLLLKRVVDIAVSLLLLGLFSPLFLIVPLANRLFCPGPTFYRQERVGLHGRVFNIIKFRSMVPDAERHTGAVWAKEGDDRVTPVGSVLRATRLDEVPQLVNVLRGEMSLVGPRPERPVFVERFAAQDPRFRLREMVKPGITGLAQVVGRYDTRPEDKLRFDLIYLASYSPLLDILILLRTVQAVVFPQSWVDSPPRWLDRLEGKWAVGRAEAAASEADAQKIRKTS